MTPVAPAAVRRRVEMWLSDPPDKVGSRPVLALRASPQWPYDPVLVVRDVPVRVMPCPTPLAVRAALSDRADGERLVLLTELTDGQLGDGVLAHLDLQQVRSIDPWELVAQMFQAAPDPTLTRGGRWIADALADHLPPGGWPVPAGPTLTRDHALRSLVAHLLGLDRDQIDSAGLLRWTTQPARLLEFVALPDELVEGLTGYLVDVAGPAVTPVLAAVRAGHGVDAIPLGLLVGLLWASDRPGPAAEVLVARTRLEPRFHHHRLTERQARALAAAAEAWVDREVDAKDPEKQVYRLLTRAETIATEIDATRLLASSTLLPMGFTQRLHDFADAVRLAVPAAGPAQTADVARAQARLAALEEHHAGDPGRLTTARMAVRLLRWLTVADGPGAATLLDAVRRQVTADGWVDRARLDLFAGDVDPRIAEAYHHLYRSVDARRARHDEQFARHLQAATSADTDPGALIRVEDVLDRVVAPILAAGRPVLLLVLDGMSVAAATELAESVLATPPWLELTPGGGSRVGVLAALPTVTEVSRCSLLSGRIATGGQAEERTALAERFPDALLLHKGALRGDAGSAFDRELTDALADPRRRLVTVVLNAIDDALDRGDPGTTIWSTDSVAGLGQLLTLAQDRVVVMLSDHGHVVDRGPAAVTRSSPSAENRWRPPEPPPGEGELLFTGRRVASAGGAVVLPWREELRYGPRKAGYHGGASAAEAVIPLLVFSAADDQAVPGWSGAPVAAPGWWREPVPVPEPDVPRAVPTPARRPTQRSSQAESLLDLLPESGGAAAPDPVTDAWPAPVEALLASELYDARRDARAPLPDTRVAAMMSVLVAGGGRATLDTLAAHAQVPAHRITGTVTALRKLLGVDGYPVIDIDPDGQTVHLDIPLLIEQFRLEVA